jgi:hypothetical protein
MYCHDLLPVLDAITTINSSQNLDHNNNNKCTSMLYPAPNSTRSSAAAQKTASVA